jgi:hypothetical protein
VCEDVLPKGRKGERVFDAVIKNESGSAEVLIEIAGDGYAPAEFERLHTAAVTKQLPYMVF